MFFFQDVTVMAAGPFFDPFLGTMISPDVVPLIVRPAYRYILFNIALLITFTTMAHKSLPLR